MTMVRTYVEKQEGGDKLRVFLEAVLSTATIYVCSNPLFVNVWLVLCYVVMCRVVDGM